MRDGIARFRQGMSVLQFESRVGAAEERPGSRILTQAKEHLEQLIHAINNPPPPPVEIPKRKQRRPSPTTSARHSPAVGGSVTAPIIGTGRSISPLPSSLSAGHHGFSHQRDSGTPTGNRPTKDSKFRKKDMIQAQLPLQPGRRVAFKMSTRAAGNAPGVVLEISGETSETGWILAEIQGNIGGDKNRRASVHPQLWSTG